MNSGFSLVEAPDSAASRPADEWLPVPPNGRRCPRTHRTHGDLYRFLRHGQGRKHIRTVHLIEPGATRGRLYFSYSDYLAMMAKLAQEQAVRREAEEVAGV